MENPEVPNVHELPKVVSEWRQMFQTLSFMAKSFEEWSYEEKETFWTHCGRLNNFYVTVRKVLSENSPELTEEDGPIKEVYGQERMKRNIDNGEDSEIYANNSYAHFHRAIRGALIRRNIDLSVLQIILDKNEISRQVMRKDPERFEKENMIKDKIESMSQFYRIILPAVFDLLDAGYTEIELSR